MIKKIIDFFLRYREKRLLQKRIKEMRERDPFIYK